MIKTSCLFDLCGRLEECPFTAFTLQIGGYQSYQPTLQAAQVIFTCSQSRSALFLPFRHQQRLLEGRYWKVDMGWSIFEFKYGWTNIYWASLIK